MLRKFLAAWLALTGVLGITAIVGVPMAYAGITVPGAPTGVTATDGNASSVVRWTAPAHDGGSRITAYKVTATPGNKTCTTTGARTCTVTGLTNGRRYEINVRASNVKGEGHASTGVQVTPLPTVSFSSPAELFSGFPAVPVTLSQSFSRTVRVDFATSNGPNGGTYDTYFIGDAAAFNPSSGTVTFAPGQTTATILFSVNTPNPGGCPIGIPASNCFPGMIVTLSSPVNARLGAVPSTNVGYDGS
jgi:Fibronectin type III domain